MNEDSGRDTGSYHSANMQLSQDRNDFRVNTTVVLFDNYYDHSWGHRFLKMPSHQFPLVDKLVPLDDFPELASKNISPSDERSVPAL
jgi:hypothetical protein